MKLPDPKTQTAAVLFELLRNSSVTSIEIKQRQKVGFPNSRVSNLKDLGLSINSKMEPYKGKKWKCHPIARYMLRDKKEGKRVYMELLKRAV